MTHKYTDEQLITAIQNSTSIHKALINLGISTAGGNYRIIHKAIKRLNINTAHFTGQASNKGKIFGPKRPINDYLQNMCGIDSNTLRKRLIQEHIFDHKCSICHLTTWLNKPIPIQLDHIDGNHENNTLSNLRLLCPNCHAQTDNYCGRKLKKLKIIKEPIDWRHRTRPNTRKVARPSKEELQQLIKELNNWCAIAKIFGVSNNAIKKWAKSYNLETNKRTWTYIK